MKVTHSVKVPIGERYSMREMSFEADTTEFPQIAKMTQQEQLMYAQSVLIMQGLAFQVAIGYIRPDSEAFQAAKASAMAMRPKEK